MKGCMNCGNISCGNNKKRDCAGCGRWISPEDKIAELERENAELKEELKDANEKVVHLACNQNKDLKRKSTKAKELLKQWLQTSKASSCDNINIVTDTEQFLEEMKEK